jgi:hypothetical protein
MGSAKRAANGAAKPSRVRCPRGFLFRRDPRSVAGDNPERGVALVMTIVIASVILILVGSWLALTTHRTSRVNRERARVQALYTAEAGIAKALWYLKGHGEKNLTWRTEQNCKDKPVREKLFTRDVGECQISVRDKGGFLQIVSVGKRGGETRGVGVVLGAAPGPEFDVALSLIRGDQPAVVSVGSEVLGGMRAKVAPRVLGGEVDPAATVVPNLGFPQFHSYRFFGLMQGYVDILANPHKADQELFGTQVYNERHPIDFSKGPVIYVNESVLFEGGSVDSPLVFKGPGTIASSGDIQVSDYVRLEDDLVLVAFNNLKLFDRAEVRNGTLFSAGGIELHDDARVTGQIFSLFDILLTDRATVIPPSFLYAASTAFPSGPGQAKPKGKITLLDHSIVNGVIISDFGLGARGAEPIVTVEEDALVNGIVYAKNMARIRGTVRGSVIANSLSEESPMGDSLGVNEIKGGRINRRLLPSGIALPLAFLHTPQFRLVSWSRSQAPFEEGDTTGTERKEGE